jgi:hypothetical protein
MPVPITLTRRHKNRPPHRKDEYPVHTEMATEQELLDFANALRSAGDADPLEALMPSTPSNEKRCLIANALNFSSAIDTVGLNRHEDGSSVWVITFPDNMAPERHAKIAADLGLKPFDGDYYLWMSEDEQQRSYVLPKHIGNAAHAFDSGDAYQEYAA